jgi:glycosyltransferase involved in cell wall biosynthesis
MRVLHVHSGNLYGGVETLLATLWRERAACPAMETSFALCFEGRLGEELRAAGAEVHTLGAARASRPLSVRRARAALARLLEANGFDIAVCHSAWSQALFGAVARESDCPQAFWMHAPATGRHWLERWARRSTPDLVVCNSRFTSESAHLLYPRTRAEVVHCPVSMGEAIPRLSGNERAAVRAELETTESSVVIAQVGRLEPLKGHGTHLEALGRLRELEGWTCWQVGGAQRPAEFNYLEDLKRQAARLGIADRVRFIGERKDVPRLLAASDIYCQPNVGPESFGLTFVEAMLARLPVVTTHIGGAREIVDESCGLFVPPGDAETLRQILQALIENQMLREKLGQCGPSRARHLCDVSKRLRDIGETFSFLVRRKAA